MRHLLPLVLLLVACSSSKPKYDPANDPASRVSTSPPLPAPPPLGPDQSEAKVTGCSESATPSERDAATWPPTVVGSRAPSATEVKLGTQAGGVWVTHNLTHACCTKAKVYVERAVGQLNFFEAVEGTPCGSCMCTSQVRAAAGVAPGRWGVALRLEDTAGSTIVQQSSFVVEPY